MKETAEETKTNKCEIADSFIYKHSIQLLPTQVHLKQLLSKYLLPNLTNLGDVYERSVLRTQDIGSPTDLSMAAFGLREILEKLPELATNKKKPPNPRGEITRLIEQSRTNPATFSAAFEVFAKAFEQDGAKRADITTTLLRILSPTLTPVPESILLVIVEKWHNFVNTFNSIAHFGRRVSNEEFSKYLEDFELFLLQIFKPQTFKDFEKLDELIEKGHSLLGNNQKIDLALISHIFSCIANTVSGASLDYFFSKLQTAKWIPYLINKKTPLFKMPPPIVKVEDRGTFHPEWPQSQYLARVADQDPQAICKLLLEAEDTDNLHVQEDYIDAALKMPVKEAAKIAKIIATRGWLKKDYTSVLPLKCADLAYSLAKAKRFGVSQLLFENLLLVPPSVQSPLEKKNSPYICEFVYAEILKKKVPMLVDLWELKSFQFVETLLTNCLQTEGLAKPAEADCSYIWHAALQSDLEQPLYLSSYLIKTLRDVGIKCLKQDLQLVDQIITALLARESGIFNRLGLHIASQIQELPLPLIDQIVGNKKYYQPVSTWGEFADFLKVHFHRASVHVKNIVVPSILESIADGSKERERWQLQVLTVIKEHLPSTLTGKFKSLQQEFGQRSHANRLVYFGPTMVGPVSPFPIEELHKKSITEILDLLQEWAPSNEWFAPSRAGLGLRLSEIVKEKPDQFLSQNHVIKLHPVYCRAILEGIKTTNELFSWENALEFCHEIVSHSDQQDDSAAFDENHASFFSLKIDVARLLQKGLLSEQLPFNLRSTIWEILQPLTINSMPVNLNEELADNTDYDTLCTYTAHGEALQNVVLYARWVKKNACAKPTSSIKAFCPEAKKVLERNLEISSNPQISIRAVYGKYLPTLVWLDQKWAYSLLPSIFPEESSLREYRAAAWNTYLKCCAPIAFELIEDLYRKHILSFECAQDPPKDKYGMIEENQRLCQHLIFLYAQEKIPLQSPQNLITLFFELAPATLKGYMIRYTGQLLKDADTITNSMVKRFQDLWDTQISQNPKLGGEELKYFGWWVLGHKLDAKWTLDRLIQIVEKFGSIDPESLIFKTLKAYTTSAPEQLFRFAEFYARQVLKTERFFSYQDDFYDLLKSLKVHLHKDLTERFQDLIHLLGTGRNLRFRSLL